MDNEREEGSLYEPLEAEETEALNMKAGQIVEPEGVFVKATAVLGYNIEGKELTLRSVDDEVTVCLGEDHCLIMGSGDEVYDRVKSLLDGLKGIESTAEEEGE